MFRCAVKWRDSLVLRPCCARRPHSLALVCLFQACVVYAAHADRAASRGSGLAPAVTDLLGDRVQVMFDGALKSNVCTGPEAVASMHMARQQRGYIFVVPSG